MTQEIEDVCTSFVDDNWPSHLSYSCQRQQPDIIPYAVVQTLLHLPTTVRLFKLSVS